MAERGRSPLTFDLWRREFQAKLSTSLTSNLSSDLNIFTLIIKTGQRNKHKANSSKPPIWFQQGAPLTSRKRTQNVAKIFAIFPPEIGLMFRLWKRKDDTEATTHTQLHTQRHTHTHASPHPLILPRSRLRDYGSRLPRQADPSSAARRPGRQRERARPH